jgi:hypothetical protein
MDARRTTLLLITAAGVLALSGASCPRAPYFPTQTAPVLPAQPTLDQVINTVNRNSLGIVSFATDEATLSGPNFPTLRRTVVAFMRPQVSGPAAGFEPPRQFRLRAESILGPELDLGSNQELFWLWVGRAEPPAVYYCRHDQFATSPARNSIPIEPDWLVEAMGIVTFDPAQPHTGPILLTGGRAEIRSTREGIDGPMTKSTVVDLQRGVVVDQRLYDPRGQLVAAATAVEHRLDPLTGLTIAKVVDIYAPRMGIQMRIDLGNVRLNRPLANAAELFTLPTYSGSPLVDMCDPRFQPMPAAPPTGPSTGAAPPGTVWRPSTTR